MSQRNPRAVRAIERQPFGYHLSLCPSVPEPPFDDPGELERVWGQRWGASDEVGRLRTVLVRTPRDEWAVVRADAWNEAAGALVDPDGMWYWESRTPPDLALVREQHLGLVAALESEGVEVVHVQEDGPPHLTRPIYTRDPLMTVPGGAIVGRMAPAMRRGEEPMVTRAVVALGMPILRTITGTGLVEAQLRSVLEELGIELVVVPMAEWSIHLDGHLGMVSPEAALVDINGLPHWFLDRLRELGIEAIPCPAGEEWAINSLALAPGRMLMADGYPRRRELLERHGFDVITIAYDKIQKGGGGVHCSTMELQRDPASMTDSTPPRAWTSVGGGLVVGRGLRLRTVASVAPIRLTGMNGSLRPCHARFSPPRTSRRRGINHRACPGSVAPVTRRLGYRSGVSVGDRRWRGFATRVTRPGAGPSSS
jgi:N-dimethylarginine dimethylaminohydrolase